MDDFRLAPILEDAALFGQNGQELLPLDLPPIQDSSLTRVPPFDYAQEAPLTPPESREAPASNFTPPNNRRTHGHDSQSHHGTLPIASVLNEDQDATPPQQTISQELHQPEHNRSRNAIELDTQAWQLPHPHTSYGADNHLPLIPPLLQGLHDPPPHAGLFPRITGDSPKLSRPTPNKIGSRKATAAEDKPISRETQPTHLQPATEGGRDPGARLRSANPQKQKSNPLRRRNKKWGRFETLSLLKGVEKHGAGNWKKILTDEAFRFMGRSAVDLKDRYRVCCTRNAADNFESGVERNPKEPRPSTGEASDAKAKATRGDAKSKPSVKELKDLGMDASIHAKEKSGNRRERQNWSSAEDAAILAGHKKHGALWAKIIKHPDLVPHNRTRNDVRDRWRILSKRAPQPPDIRTEPAKPKGDRHVHSRDTQSVNEDEYGVHYVDPSATWKHVPNLR